MTMQTRQAESPQKSPQDMGAAIVRAKMPMFSRLSAIRSLMAHRSTNLGVRGSNPFRCATLLRFFTNYMPGRPALTGTRTDQQPALPVPSKSPTQLVGFIYVASPYTHPDPAVAQARYERVADYSAKCMLAGEFVFSPIAHHHPIAQRHVMPTDWEFWKRIDTAMLASSVGMRVLMMPGWEKSVGVTAEIEIAKELGIPVEFVPWQ